MITSKHKRIFGIGLILLLLAQPAFAASTTTPGGTAPPDAATSNAVMQSKECQSLQNQANAQLSSANTITSQVAQNQGHLLDGVLSSLKDCLSGLMNMNFNFNFNIPICAILYNVTNGLMEQLTQNINFPYGMGGVGMSSGAGGALNGGGGNIGLNGSGSTGVDQSGGYANGSGSGMFGNSSASGSASKNAIFGAGASGTPQATTPNYQGYATGQVQNPTGSSTPAANSSLWDSAKGLFK